MSLLLLAISFFFIAGVYASVGFGGGSSYIAILLLVGMLPEEVRLTALICNIIVVSGTVIQYYCRGMIPWRKIVPVVMLSVPMAFLGGMIQLDSAIYKITAAVCLLIASGLMLMRNDASNSSDTSLSNSGLTAVGGGIGFLSGVIGIGGGIFLAPLLHLMRWETARTISITASLFILVNSLAGLAGQLTHQPTIDTQKVIMLGLAVALGGQIGSHINIKMLQPKYIRLVTAVLIAVVAVRLLILNLS